MRLGLQELLDAHAAENPAAESAGLEPDAPFRMRVLAAATVANCDTDIERAIIVAAGERLDLIGRFYGLHRWSPTA